MKYGYARVSTDAQELGRQIAALKDAKCDEIFQEKVSGGKVERPELNALLSKLKKGDALIVPKLDRLARSLTQLIAIMNELDKKKVAFISLGDSFDTSTANGKLMFHIVGAFAEFERSIIRERVKDGIKHKRTLNTTWGPAPKVDRTRVIAMLEAGFGPSKIAQIMKCSRQWVHNIQRINQEEKL